MHMCEMPAAFDRMAVFVLHYPCCDIICHLSAATVLLPQWLVYTIHPSSRNAIQCWKACEGAMEYGNTAVIHKMDPTKLC